MHHCPLYRSDLLLKFRFRTRGVGWHGCASWVYWHFPGSAEAVIQSENCNQALKIIIWPRCTVHHAGQIVALLYAVGCQRLWSSECSFQLPIQLTSGYATANQVVRGSLQQLSAHVCRISHFAFPVNTGRPTQNALGGVCGFPLDRLGSWNASVAPGRTGERASSLEEHSSWYWCSWMRTSLKPRNLNRSNIRIFSDANSGLVAFDGFIPVG